MKEHIVSAQFCLGFLQRLRGLLGKPAPAPGQGLWLRPCAQVHTLGLSYPLDIMALDDSGKVLALEHLRPWRLGKYHHGATGILEMRAGEVHRLGIAVGDRMVLQSLEGLSDGMG